MTLSDEEKKLLADRLANAKLVLAFDKQQGICPVCGVFAYFQWSDLQAHKKQPTPCTCNTKYKGAFCSACNTWSIWAEFENPSHIVNPRTSWSCVYPKRMTAPEYNSDLPEECRAEYNEARAIVYESPRGAAALLRLCIQKLCVNLGKSGKDLNKDIGDLVKDGLDERIKNALDIVRVTGNHAVHPGEMDIQDNPEIVNRLFKLVNWIVEEMYTKPKELKELYSVLPDGAKEGIEKRDRNK